MRHLLSLLVLTVAGCGSTSWFGGQRSAAVVCDGATSTVGPLGHADSVSLDPAPVMQSPMTELPVIEYPAIEGSASPAPDLDDLPDMGDLPDLDSDSPSEPVPVPTPDPST